MKKGIVLFILFVLPLVAYLFFASGVNNFGRLPIVTEAAISDNQFQNTSILTNKITVLGFLGNDIENRKGNVFNLNQKIYKRFNGFEDFQLVMLVPEGNENKVETLKKELGTFTDVSNWNFEFKSSKEITALFNQLKTNLNLDNDLYTPYVFIVDKKGNLRGRTDDEDEGLKYGFDTSRVADLNNKMEDDVKIILAEYRMARKENNARKFKK